MRNFFKNYNESLSYDKNGNITALQRNGEYEDNVTQLQTDNLNYFYPTNSNRLMKVTDATNTPSGFKDDSNGTNDTVDDYSYDANGNMITDQNKAITSIKYNHLNLPTEIIFSGTNRKINYLYNANGTKKQKMVTRGTLITTTDYLDGFQYVNTVLEFFPTAEGYVKSTISGTSATYNYVFNYTDHLGNVRLSYGYGILSKGNYGLFILQENNYYPFGLQHNGYNMTKYDYDINNTNGGATAVIINTFSLDYLMNKYKYNSQEWQDELSLNVTAMDFRQYEPAIGRFSVMDPLSELTPTHNPYRFGFNNPVYWSDPSGLFETRKEAREYKKEHGISGGISKQKDGSFAINDKKNSVSYSKGDDSQANEIFNNDGVQESALVQAPSKKESSSGGTGFGWMTIWGIVRSGDVSGWKGTTTHSVESSDFVTPGDARSLNNKTSGILEWIFSLFKNSTDTYTQGITIQEAVKKNGNTATIEVQNTEPVVTSSVKVVTYTFHLNDSTVTKNTNTVDFKGKASDVKKQVDSTNNRNNVRNADKSAWLSSWGK